MSGSIDKEIALLKKNQRPFIAICIFAIIGISCLPLLMAYLPYNSSHDLVFHLFRIEGLAEGLKNGEFPVRMQTSQLHGYGYPVSICYGDLFLYIPAFLRILGLSIKSSYSIFVLLVNTFCATSTYIVFKRMTKSTSIALVISALWTWAPYRLIDDIWLRASVGEYLALSFFPIILYGLFSIFYFEKVGASKYGWVWCALGVCGIVYSHVLSIILAAFVFVPLFLLLLVKNHSKQIIKSILSAFVLIVLLSLAFIVPFLDYYHNADMRVTSNNAIDKQQLAASNALQPIQLLLFMPAVASISTDALTVNEMPFSLGWAVILGVLTWLLTQTLPSVRKTQSKSFRRFGILLFIISVLLAIVSSVYFPWSYENGIFGTLISVVAVIQFPWRFVGPLSFTLIVLIAMGLVCFTKSLPFLSISYVQHFFS